MCFFWYISKFGNIIILFIIIVVIMIITISNNIFIFKSTCITIYKCLSVFLLSNKKKGVWSFSVLFTTFATEFILRVASVLGRCLLAS